jgi:hypothetical protein
MLTIFGPGLGTAVVAATLLDFAARRPGLIAVALLLVAVLHPKGVGGRLAGSFLARAGPRAAHRRGASRVGGASLEPSDSV